MPIIRACIIQGRSTDQKNALARGIAQAAVDALQVPVESVRVLIEEVPPTHWYVAGKSKADERSE